MTSTGEAPKVRRRFRRFGGRRRKLPPAQPLDYKNFEYLKTLMTPQGKMFSRKRTFFTGKDQKKFKLAVKRARFLALIPYVT